MQRRTCPRDWRNRRQAIWNYGRHWDAWSNLSHLLSFGQEKSQIPIRTWLRRRVMKNWNIISRTPLFLSKFNRWIFKEYCQIHEISRNCAALSKEKSCPMPEELELRDEPNIVFAALGQKLLELFLTACIWWPEVRVRSVFIIDFSNDGIDS